MGRVIDQEAMIQGATLGQEAMEVSIDVKAIDQGLKKERWIV